MPPLNAEMLDADLEGFLEADRRAVHSWSYWAEQAPYWLENIREADFQEPSASQFTSWVLHSLSSYRREELSTVDFETESHARIIYRYINVFLQLKEEFESVEVDLRDRDQLEQQALATIGSEFSQFEEVKSIYVQRFRDQLQIRIPLSIESYDFDLMRSLLETEYEIREAYSEFVFDFSYPPVGNSDEHDCIHPMAQCIYIKAS